jgi:ABC-2 type transport system permease protein
VRLFLEHFRRSWKTGFLIGTGVFAFHLVVLFVFRSIQEGTSPAFLSRLLPKGIQAFLGMDRLPVNTIGGFLAVVYQHPFMLAAFLAFPVVAGSAFLAGEVERKTIALLLCRPIRRISMVISSAAVCAVWLAVLVACACGGTYVGVGWVQAEPPDYMQLAAVALNLYLLGLAVSGISIMFSAMLSERGDAAGWTVTAVLVMYVGNFIGQVWPAAKPFAGYSLFNYFTPGRIFVEGAAPLLNLYVTGGVFLVTVLVGCVAFARREFLV